MHELFYQVLNRRDLSKAGDLFSIEDSDIAEDLSEVLSKIQEIASAPNYLSNDNNQSVVEICITRVTSAIRETGSIEKHAPALVSLLQSCLKHNLRPSVKDEDPPHAKIASDILSCVFLNYSKKSVMELAIPVAVKFLHQGNKELCRNISSYLSLAAIENTRLLAQNVAPIIDSCCAGNRSLVRVLPQIYLESKGAVQGRVADLVRLLPNCEPAERMSILQLLTVVVKDKPNLLEPHLGHLCDYLSSANTSQIILQMFVDMATVNAHPFVNHVNKLKQSCDQQPANLSLGAKIIGPVGKTNKVIARDCMTYLVSQLPNADSHSMPVILKEVKSISDRYPAALPDLINEISKYSQNATASARATIQQLKELCAKIGSKAHLPDRRSAGIQTEGTVTVVTVGNPPNTHALINHMTGSLTTASLSSSMTLTQYRNASTSTREINFPGSSLALAAQHLPPGYVLQQPYTVPSAMTLSSASGVATINTTSGSIPYSMVPALTSSKHSISSKPSDFQSQHSILEKQFSAHGSQAGVNLHGEDRTGSGILHHTLPHGSYTLLAQHCSPRHHHHHHHPNHQSTGAGTTYTLSTITTPSLSQSLSASQTTSSTTPIMPVIPQPTPTSPAQTPTALVSPTQLGGHYHRSLPTTSAQAPTNTYTGQPHAIPFRDAVQQFCEKHMDKIKAYMEHVFVKLPVPIKAKMEEHKHKRQCRIHFVCFGRGEHCLYPQNFFSFKTRNPRYWIHVMFLAVQARSHHAVCQQDPSVGNLKACWDMLRMDSGSSFVRLVTSSFPSARDQDILLQELYSVRYFDVFEFNASEQHWACFVCNHPEKVEDLLQDGNPSIEGQLKEKKGKWKFLKRWKTRYFTLSGATITYNKKDSKETLPVCKIQSVKAVRKGVRDIPKAFEIFTNDQTYVFKVKDGKNAEQWVQCLQIAVARSQNPEESGRERVRERDLAPGWDFGSGLVMPIQKSHTHSNRSHTKL